MAEQEVKERVAIRVYMDWNKLYEGEGLEWEELPEYRKATYREWVNEYIFRFMKQVGYVRLAEGQSLPKMPESWEGCWYGVAYAQAQQDMLKTKFRKVEL